MHHSANDHRHPRCPRSWTNVGLSGLRADETGKRKNALVGSASCCGMTRPEGRLKKGLSREWREGQGDSGWFLASHYEAKRDACLLRPSRHSRPQPHQFASPTRRHADPPTRFSRPGQLYEAKRDASLTTAFATLQAATHQFASPTRRSADPPIRRPADTPTRRSADTPTRRSADPFLPPADPFLPPWPTLRSKAGRFTYDGLRDTPGHDPTNSLRRHADTPIRRPVSPARRHADPPTRFSGPPTRFSRPGNFFWKPHFFMADFLETRGRASYSPI